MNLKQLEIFYAIMTTGSVTAAARNLNVTQPAISNVLRHAEQQLKFRLFERKGGRLHPTAEANMILPDVNEIFGRLGTLNRVIQGISDGTSAHIVIATSPTLVYTLVAPTVALIRARSPTLQLQVLSLPTALVVGHIARREADVGVIYAPADDPGVETEDLITTEIACAVPRTHPLANHRFVGVTDLAEEAFISVGAHTRLGRLIEIEFRNAGVPPPQIRIDAGSSVAACLMVSEGVGIALVDRATPSAGRFKDLAFLPFRPKLKAKIQLIYPRDRPHPRALANLAEDLRDVIAKKQRDDPLPQAPRCR